MAEDPPETEKSAMGGLLGALGLSPKALLAVTLLAVAVWWYWRSQGPDMQLSNSETAVIVLALALVFVGVRAVFGLLRRRASTSDKPQ
ncbi:hypothetical protein [Roseiarcus sp.]|uniref:hypothetical protein n=1 Tax=Roseiarcus sp. TaxID=1969460 RepID=UPI003F9A5F4B